MPSDLVRRLNLDLLYPPFLEKLLETLAGCRAAGQDYWATSGTRTMAEQAALYFQGRTAPGKIVTNARPGMSLHNYGIAVDCTRDADLTKPGLQPDWGSKYGPLKTEGNARGLQVGVPSVPGGDLGHVQLPVHAVLKEPEAVTCARLKRLYDKGGYPEVWRYLDSLAWPTKS